MPLSASLPLVATGTRLAAFGQRLLQAFDSSPSRWTVFADEGFTDWQAGLPSRPPSGPAEAAEAYVDGYAEAEFLDRVW